jgi:ABC-type multidrug transport system ATPase subunit
LRDVAKSWDKRKPPLLDAITLAFQPKTLISIVGRNGVGKTNILRIMAGLIFPTRGAVELFGIQPDRDRR